MTCMPVWRARHRHEGLFTFLKHIDCETPKPPQIHMIRDSHATRKRSDVKNWLGEEITDKAIRRGVLLSVPDLISAIEWYLNAHNDNPMLFVWVASVEGIFEKVSRARVALEVITS
ncbi:MAG: hypothetical protein ACYC1I_11530 [Acidimicrobiales bacterium]